MTARSPRYPGTFSRLAAILRFEAASRLRVTAALAMLFSLFGGIYLWVGPQLVAGEAIQEMLDAMPPLLVELLGFESLGSLEGLLAGEFYTLAWIVGFGAYIAYTAAAAVAGDLQNDRMDTVLAAPVSRRSVLLGTYLALLAPIVLVNMVVPVTLFLGSVAVGDVLALHGLLMVHLLSMPYLLLWGAVGVLLGVLIRGGRRAGRVAIGLVFALWVFESVIGTTDVAWLGSISPVRYFDPHAILVLQRYDLEGAGILLAGTALLLGLAHVRFRHMDV